MMPFKPLHSSNQGIVHAALRQGGPSSWSNVGLSRQ